MLKVRLPHSTSHRPRTVTKGDTLIEVLFAITTFSLVVVSSLAIMNQGTAAATRSLQMTVVRQEIDSQAETLRFLNAAYVAAYHSGYAPDLTDASTSPAEEYYRIARSVTNAPVTTFGGSNPSACQSAPSSSFIINTRLARYVVFAPSKMVPAEAYAKVTYNSDDSLNTTAGMWIEATRAVTEPGKPKYVDYHIRACWSATGTGVPVNIGTIVRLYEPAN